MLYSLTTNKPLARKLVGFEADIHISLIKSNCHA